MKLHELNDTSPGLNVQCKNWKNKKKENTNRIRAYLHSIDMTPFIQRVCFRTAVVGVFFFVVLSAQIPWYRRVYQFFFNFFCHPYFYIYFYSRHGISYFRQHLFPVMCTDLFHMQNCIIAVSFTYETEKGVGLFVVLQMCKVCLVLYGYCYMLLLVQAVYIFSQVSMCEN